MDLEKSPTQQRRRGEELEDALLEAAWQELEQNGYAAFTFDAVAQRAHTSRPVIYRRWTSREDLVLSAIRRHFDHEPIVVPDAGNLRDDLFALLRLVSANRSGLGAIVTVQLSALYGESGTSLAEVRRRLMGTRTTWDSVVLSRANARGEIDLKRIPESVRSLPVDLLRHRLLMTLEPADDEYIATIVDDIFLPLMERYAPIETALNPAN